MFKDKFIYLIVLLGGAYLLYKGVELLAFKGIPKTGQYTCKRRVLKAKGGFK